MDLEELIPIFNGDEDDSSHQMATPPEELLDYAKQILNFFSTSPDPSKLDFYLGLSFPHSKTKGLLGYLGRKITERSHDKVKEVVFQLIEIIVAQRAWRADVNRFCIGFKNTSDMYWKHSKETARLQQAALSCMICLFENYGTSVDLSEFDAPQLYLELLQRSEKSKYQPTVRGKMFHLMGILGSLGHNTFMKQKDWFPQLFNHVTTTVKSQVESSDAHLEVSILHGCLKGLNNLLNVFSIEVNVQDTSWLKFQEHLEQVVDPSTSILKGDRNKIKRREFQRAALELVANHGSLIQAGLFKKYKQWFTDLIAWSKSANADDNRIGRRAMYKFLDTVLIEYPNNFKENTDGKQLAELQAFYNFFIEKFRDVLNTKHANRIELEIAVRGFGMLSNLCVDQKGAHDMLELIMVHINNIIHELDSPVVDKYNSSISVISTYLDSVASILSSLKSGKENDEILEKHLDSIKKLTILLIRFFPDLSEIKRSYVHISVQKVFDSLWNHHHAQCEPFIEQVYQQSLLHIVSSPTKAEVDILIESWNRSHPESKRSAQSQLGLKPVSSFMQFWKLLLSRSESGSHVLRFDLLMQWILTSIGKLDLSIKFEDDDTSESTLDPVQGATATVMKDFQIFVNLVEFYQELMSANQLHEKFSKWIVPFSYEMLGYIKSNTFVSGFYKILSLVFDSARKLRYFEEETNLEKRNLHEALNGFFQGLGTRIREFRDDLLFSVLEFWLSLPDALILTNLTALNHTLKTVFATGRNSFPLAIKGLEAIERWFFQKEFPVDEITTIMNNIFPVLKTYFITSEYGNELETRNAESETTKVDIKTRIKRRVQTSKPVEDTTLKAIQMKILQLIGSFGQFIQLHEKGHLGLSKDQHCLKYDVPFQDCKPHIYIDALLPRVLELCEDAVERQTRISSCEFFHTIALIFIGISPSREGKNEKLFRRVFQAVLKLGCDSDIVVRQLFNPLCLQMIHWFSKRNSPYGVALMEILTENLTQHDDSNLRELAALCVGEYFQWSIRHQIGGDTDTKAKGVLKSIFAMSTHASHNYRQGSVMAFNSIYRDFREDTGLTSEFSFNLLYSFLTSLKLSKNLPDDCLLITSTKQAIKHLQRIFVKKKDRFNTALPRQFKPNAGSTGKSCLQDVLEWVLCESGSDSKVYREECIRLIEVLCPITRGIGSVNKFLTNWEESRGIEDWINIAEGTGNLDSLTFLDAASSFYAFLFKHGMLRKAIYSSKRNSKFLEHLIKMCEPPSTASINDEGKECLLNIISRLKFASEVLNWERLEPIWAYSMELSKLMTTFDRPNVIPTLIEVWCNGELPASTKLSLGSLLAFEPAEDVNSVSDDQRMLILKEAVWHRAMAEGRLSSHLLAVEKTQPLVEKIWCTILNTLFKQSTGSASAASMGWEANHLATNTTKIIENYMITALFLGLDEKMVVDAVFDSTSVSYRDGTFQLIATKGEIFQKQLLRTLVHCDELFKFNVLLQERAIKDVGDFIQRLLGLIKSDKNLRKQFGENIFKQALTNWKMISVNCDVATSVKIFAGLLAVNINECRNSEQLSSWWNGPRLMQARHLDLKQKAEVFGYVLVFAESRKKKITDAVVNTISHLVDTTFKHEQSWTDVEQYVTFIFRKILKVFEVIPTDNGLHTPLLFAIQKISHWLKDSPDHALFRMTREVVEKVLKVRCETEGERISLVSHIYQLSTSEINTSLVECPIVWKSFLVPAVSFLSTTATKNFFKRHIYDILSKMEGNPTTIYQWKAKTLGLYLVEMMIYQTSGEFIKGKELLDAYISNASSEIKNEYAKKNDDEKNRTIYRTITSMSVFGITKSADIPNEDTEMRQCMFHCLEACFNTVVALLLVTKAEFKFFQGFLLPGKLFYDKLVDDRLTFEFPLFVDEANHKSGVLLRSRKVNASNDMLDDELTNLFPTSGNLTGSSLAPEATNFDFTTSVTVANSEYYQKIFANSALDGGNPRNIGTAVDKLEWNEINQHGCMFAFVETLKRLRQYHRDKEDVNRNWPTSLAKFLTNERVHKNVKTFFVGGIINTPESVEPFAAELVDPIIRLILADCFGSIKLNHFVQDVIITLLSWTKTPGARPSNELVTGILKYILEGVRNEEVSNRKDVLNHALDILENVIRYWVIGAENAAVIPWREIGALGSNNPTDESSELKLHVCLHILLGGQLPHTEVVQFMKMLTKSLTSKYKGVYITAAKCIGRLLRKIEDEAPPEFREQHIQLVTMKLINMSGTKPPVFVQILTAVQSYFPEMMIRVRESVMELCQFPKVRSELLSLLPLLLKQQLAELDGTISITPSSPNCVDNFFTDIDGRGVLKQPCKTDSELVAALDLFELLIGNVGKASKLVSLVDWLTNAENSHKSKIKAKFATCLTKLYDRLLDEAAQTLKPVESEHKQAFLRVFVRMYEDENEEVHNAVNLFWTKVLHEWNQSADLMLEIFDLIGQEEHPLNVFIGLILRRCSLSPDYSKNIFQHPLENIQFVPFELDTSWRLRHSTFQPLFAESLSSVQNFSTLPRAIQSSLFSQRRSVGKFGMNVLRATLANLQFTPTQQQVESDSVVSEDQMMEVEMANFQFEQFKAASTGTGSKSSSMRNEESLSSSLENPILKMRKKFYARKDSTFYAHRGSEMRTERIEETKDLERARVSGVKTVRSYRIGELPDILISHSDLLNTLLKLAKQDENIARQFLRLLFQGILQEIQHDQRKSRTFLSKARDVFDRVFRNICSSPDSSLSTLMMELSITNKITLPTTIVLDVCKICNLQKLGILKLEEELIDEGVSENHTSKRSRQVIQSESGEKVWLGLAEMYKEIEEYDVLRNIFSCVVQVTTNDLRKSIYENIGEALHLEGMGYLEKAVEMYDHVLDASSDDVISTTGKMFLEDSLMNCLAKLGNWDSLYTLATKFNPVTSEDLFHNRQIAERFIPMQMLSGMQLTLRHEEEEDDIQVIKEFHSFVENSLTTEEGTNFLTTSYPFDVGVWLLLENEDEYASQANLLIEKGYENLLRHLKNMDSLPLKVQRHVVVSLQQSSVLHDYLKWRKHGQTFSVLDGPTWPLLGNWSKFLKHEPFDLLGNNLVVSHRDNFLSKIGVTLQELGAGDAVLLSIQELRVDQELWLANLGAAHKNFSIAQTSLARLKETGRDDIRPIEFRKSMAVTLTAFSKLLEPVDWCKRWCSVWKKLDKIGEGNVDSIKVDLLTCLCESAGAERVEGASSVSVFKALGVDSSRETLSSCLQKMAESFMLSATQDISLYRNLFHLFKRLSDTFSNITPGVTEKMLCCLLRGCSEQGNADEMLLISNIFPMLKKCPDLNAVFDGMASSVPSFLFLPWIDQIMTAYKSYPQEYTSFQNLIKRLVKDFPQAFLLQYPEHVNKKCYLFRDALKALVLPFKLHERIVQSIVVEKDKRKGISLLKDFQVSLQEIINNYNKFYGEYHTDYATEMFEIVNGVLTDNQKSSQSSDSAGSQHEPSSQAWQSAIKEVEKLADAFAKRGQREKFIQLEKLSPFLSNFHFFDYESVETPGLYGDFRKPKIQEHSVIVSFHPTVVVYNSITRPIRVTVLTNDGKQRNFLSKLGDDLRQDRRIQQLFKMSNVLFRKDVALRKKNLNLETYACIPITPDFGLIEMIDNVMSLKEIIFDTPELENMQKSLTLMHDKWLINACGSERPRERTTDHYRITARVVERERIEKFYIEMVSKIPAHTLRDHIIKRSANLSEFFSIRQNLITSYGALCMVHWLLGIGDRHLENCLLSMRTGNLVGIDFGRAFGTSNYVIPVPEMIPFRMTPQIQTIMMPYSYKGLFRESCIQTWNCLIDTSEVILTVADVFIQEPTMDWLKLRQSSKAGVDDGSEREHSEHEMESTTNRDYFPFEIMKKKLLCRNPTDLLVEELKMHTRRDISVIYSKIAEDGRLFREKEATTSEEYVDILLDLATDKNILSRIYCGWNSWV